MYVKCIYKKIEKYLIDYDFPDENRTKMDWLVRLRWIAISVQLFTLYFAVKLDWLNQPFITIYLIIVTSLIILNTILAYYLKSQKSTSSYFIFFQLILDLIEITSLLLMSGGIWNPFAQIVFLNVFFGAFLLSGKYALIFFVSSIVSIFFLQFPIYIPKIAQIESTSSQYILPAQLTVCTFLFIFTHWLAYSLRLQKKYTEKLQTEKNRLDNLRALGALSSGFSHEFATPLNTIKLKINRLSKIEFLKKQDDFKIILNALNRCENSLKQMHLHLLSNTKDNYELKNIAFLTEQIIKFWNQSSRKSHCSIHDNCLNVLCSIPLFPFTKAIIDILDNAEEASRVHFLNQTPTKEIEIFTEICKKNDFISIAISDLGTGWPEVVKTYAGQPFLTTKENGVGLGLYHGFTFAASVGGKLILTNNKNGKGATAEFLIPIHKESIHDGEQENINT